MKYKLKLLFLFLNLTILNYSAEQEIQLLSVDEQFIENFKINTLSIQEKKDLYDYLTLQIQALDISYKKKELEKEINVKLYHKQKIEIENFTKIYFETKKSASQLYNSSSKRTKKRIDKVMTYCLQQDTSELCKIKLQVILNYIKTR